MMSGAAIGSPICLRDELRITAPPPQSTSFVFFIVLLGWG